MDRLILGIDIGTTSLKTAVYTVEGKQVASAVLEYSLLTPETNIVEAPCEIYMDSLCACMRMLRKNVDTRKIGVVGFSVQGETLCMLDESCKPLGNAIVWMDNRAVRQAQALRAHFGDELCYEVTGQVSFEACWPAAKVLWVRENEPERFAKIRHLLLLEDYIIFLLTGKFVAEGSLLTSTEYWDIRTKDYWNEMLEFIGIDPAWLPEVRESGEPVGTVLPEMAELLGLSEDTLISTGCLDQAAGAIGGDDIGRQRDLLAALGGRGRHAEGRGLGLDARGVRQHALGHLQLVALGPGGLDARLQRARLQRAGSGGRGDGHAGHGDERYDDADDGAGLRQGKRRRRDALALGAATGTGHHRDGGRLLEGELLGQRRGDVAGAAVAGGSAGASGGGAPIRDAVGAGARRARV